MEDYLSQLNQQQREAVEFCSAPELVIAGAGSGKTRVLTYKIVHLLRLGYKPYNILALTFTNKAADEMRDRIELLVGPETAAGLRMGTFHSVFAKILRVNAPLIGYSSNFTIYDSADSRSLIKTIIRDLKLNDKIYTPAKVQGAISWAKNSLISPEQYAADRELMAADSRARRPELATVYRIYRDRCVASVAMDFDDLLFYTFKLFNDNPDVCNRYRDMFRYVLVDEYQDTNFAQYRIINQLCQGRQCLMVVGDDAQSIYSFRGANIANILHLDQDYPDLRQFKLEQNYRSTQNIINAAGSLIKKNLDQIPKNVFSRNDSGERIRVIEAYTDMEEARLIAAAISARKMRTGDSYNDFAILYRTNAQSRVLEEALRTRNIPYRIYGGLSFYQRKEVKDAVAYFRMVINPDDDEALRRIINFPARGIGDTTLGKLTSAAMHSGVSIWRIISDPADFDIDINRGTLAKLTGFARLIESFREADSVKRLNAYEMVRKIIKETGMMTGLLGSDTPENISRRENIEELMAAAKNFVEERQEQGNPEIFLTDMLAEVSLATDQDSETGSDDPVSDRVTMMTVHGAKGLEFNNVYIVGVEEDLFPSALSQETMSQIEEERRLLYVAITRARNHCTISYAKSRFRMGMTNTTRPSRFLADIDPIYLSAPGTTLGRAASSPRPTPIQRKVVTPANANPLNLNSLRSSSPAHSVPSRSSNDGSCSRHTISELSVGMRIRHASFGTGVIDALETTSTDDRIRVTFDTDPTPKLLLLKFAKFEIL